MKVKTLITVDPKVKENFNKVCKDNFINRSAYLQGMMIELIEKFTKESVQTSNK